MNDRHPIYDVWESARVLLRTLPDVLNADADRAAERLTVALDEAEPLALAAPDLLAACEAAAVVLEAAGIGPRVATDCRAAITKATQEATP